MTSGESIGLAERVAALEARLRILEDEREIRTVLAMYGFTADSGLDDAFVNLGVEDVVYEVNQIQADGSARVTRTVGRAEMLRYLVEMTHSRTGFLHRSMHIQDLNVVIEVDGDTAQANTYSVTLGADADNHIVFSYAGDTTWVFRRVEGRWRIAERRRRRIGTPDFKDNLEPAMANHLPRSS